MTAMTSVIASTRTTMVELGAIQHCYRRIGVTQQLPVEFISLAEQRVERFAYSIPVGRRRRHRERCNQLKQTNYRYRSLYFVVHVEQSVRCVNPDNNF